MKMHEASMHEPLLSVDNGPSAAAAIPVVSYSDPQQRGHVIIRVWFPEPPANPFGHVSLQLYELSGSSVRNSEGKPYYVSAWPSEDKAGTLKWRTEGEDAEGENQVLPDEIFCVTGVVLQFIIEAFDPTERYYLSPASGFLCCRPRAVNCVSLVLSVLHAGLDIRQLLVQCDPFAHADLVRGEQISTYGMADMCLLSRSTTKRIRRVLMVSEVVFEGINSNDGNFRVKSCWWIEIFGVLGGAVAHFVIAYAYANGGLAQQVGMYPWLDTFVAVIATSFYSFWGLGALNSGISHLQSILFVSVEDLHMLLSYCVEQCSTKLVANRPLTVKMIPADGDVNFAIRALSVAGSEQGTVLSPAAGRALSAFSEKRIISVAQIAGFTSLLWWGLSNLYNQSTCARPLAFFFLLLAGWKFCDFLLYCGGSLVRNLIFMCGKNLDVQHGRDATAVQVLQGLDWLHLLALWIIDGYGIAWAFANNGAQCSGLLLNSARAVSIIVIMLLPLLCCMQCLYGRKKADLSENEIPPIPQDGGLVQAEPTN